MSDHVMGVTALHGDDTLVPVLAPRAGKTKTGRLWVYLRDERPYAGLAPPAVIYRYSPDRTGEQPQRHRLHASIGYRAPAPEVFVPALNAWPATQSRPASPAM